MSPSNTVDKVCAHANNNNLYLGEFLLSCSLQQSPQLKDDYQHIMHVFSWQVICVHILLSLTDIRGENGLKISGCSILTSD